MPSADPHTPSESPAEALARIAAAVAAAPPGAGEVTGGVIAVAAGLCEAVARASLDEWDDGPGVVVQAVELRRRAETLARENARAYRAVRSALEPVAPGATGHDGRLRATLLHSAEVPLALARTAADCATLAAAIARGAHPDARADAIGAAELAAGAARAAAWLVEVNLALLEDDPFRVEARAVVAAAEAARAAARAG